MSRGCCAGLALAEGWSPVVSLVPAAVRVGLVGLSVSVPLGQAAGGGSCAVA